MGKENKIKFQKILEGYGYIVPDQTLLKGALISIVNYMLDMPLFGKRDVAIFYNYMVATKKVTYKNLAKIYNMTPENIGRIIRKLFDYCRQIPWIECKIDLVTVR